MARYTGPKWKISRRENASVFGDEQWKKRMSLPGVHGQSRSRPSQYAVQFREKQKVKRMYGMMEKQFRRFFKIANKSTGNTGLRMLQLLELRLDNVVYRLGLASSRNFARQLIRHGHITVNERMISVPSYQLKSNDKIGINTARRAQPYWQETIKRLSKNDRLPKWLSLDSVEISGRIERLPAHDDLNIGLETPLIVEYYSR